MALAESLLLKPTQQYLLKNEESTKAKRNSAADLVALRLIIANKVLFKEHGVIYTKAALEILNIAGNNGE